MLGLTDVGTARVSASPIYSSVILADNPQGYWRLGEAPGSTTALDSSPFGRNGTYMGGVTLGVAGAIVADPNTAARFNGSTGYVNIAGAPFNYANNFSLEAWVINNNTAVGRIFSNRTATGGYGFGILPGGQLRFTTFAVKDYDSSVIVPRDSNFHFVAVTFDNTNAANFYLDGTFRQRITGVQPGLSGGTEFDIGRNPLVSSQEFFNGTIDEAAVFNRVLSDAEIARQFQAGIAVTLIPEPSTLALFGLGVCGLLGHAWRRRKRDGVRAGALSGLMPEVEGQQPSVRCYSARNHVELCRTSR
jgi:hypothetical protein